MKLLKTVVLKTISSLPRSRALLACCRYYCQCWGDHKETYENNSDVHTNGELRVLRELAPHLGIVFDVGANIGEWTSLLPSLTPKPPKVYAFEPSNGAFAKLKTRGLPSNVLLHNVALSSRVGHAPLYVFGEASGLNSLHNRHGIEGRHIESAEITEEVTLETMDTFCNTKSLRRIDLAKIDTEGHEVDVLHGAGECLEAGIIQRIQFEYGGTYIDSRRLLKDVFEVFAPLDYTVFLITQDGLTAYQKYDQRLENFQYKNFIAFHNSVIEATPSANKAMRRTR